MTPPAASRKEEFTARVARALEALRPLLERRPLLVSSKGVGRIMNVLLGGEGRMQVGNGEIVEFAMRRDSSGRLAVAVSRPHQV